MSETEPEVVAENDHHDGDAINHHHRLDFPPNNKQQHQLQATTPQHREDEAAASAAAIAVATDLSSLQLPHMPSFHSLSNLNGMVHSSTPPSTSSSTSSSSALPSIRLLVVADLDLTSAAALAEYALMPSQKSRFSRVDMCLALGPLGRRQDLQPYLAASSCGNAITRLVYNNGCHPDDDDDDDDDDHGGVGPADLDDDDDDDEEEDEEEEEDDPPHEHREQNSWSSSSESSSTSSSLSTSSCPKSLEESAALEGLVTGALSQLESMVCRVLYCPGRTDPPTLHTNTSTAVERRLTPNSRNLQASWIPVAPGLGCAGLYHPHQHNNDNNNNNHHHHRNDYNHHQHQLHDHHKSSVRDERVYQHQLSRLIQLAPPPPLPLDSNKSQTILVTTNHHHAHHTHHHAHHHHHHAHHATPFAKAHDGAAIITATAKTTTKPGVVIHIVATSPHSTPTTSTTSHANHHDNASHATTPTTPSALTCCLQGSTLYVGSLRHSGTFCFLDIALLESRRGGGSSSNDNPEEEPHTNTLSSNIMSPLSSFPALVEDDDDDDEEENDNHVNETMAEQPQHTYQWQVIGMEVLNINE